MARIKKEVLGNTEGIKKSILIELTKLYDIKSNVYCDERIVEAAARVTELYNREVNVVISSKGTVLEIALGSHASVALGVEYQNARALHTHPNCKEAGLSDLDVAVFKASQFKALAAVAVFGGEALGAEVIFLDGQTSERMVFPSICSPDVLPIINRVKKRTVKAVERTSEGAERALLVGVEYGGFKVNLAELKDLAKTAGALVVEEVTQKLNRPETATCVGKGKLEEIGRICGLKEIDIVIFDNALSGIMIRNLENALNVKVIDRFMLILDIFAGRAKSNEGKLQVELAQLKYNTTRLIGSGGKLAKMRSGIGMRGPGEKKLEVDRRVISNQIYDLEQKIEKLKQQRDLRRVKRQKSASKLVALVGYTNAGKSTLLNALAKSDEFCEDKLFATLDPVTRRVFLGENREILLTDTVGFIDKLPHEFIDAFSSTLEEARQADLILHIIDAANPEYIEQQEVVRSVLEKLEICDVPMIDVFNKSDKLNSSVEIGQFCTPNSVMISAKEGDIDTLKEKIRQLLF